MNLKNVIAAIVVVVIVVAAVAVIITLDDDENAGFTGVVYDGNGGVTEDGESTFRLTEEAAFINMFTYEGRVFTGWNSAADGSGTSYSPGDAISYPAGGHVTLYAQWAYALSISISYGGSMFGSDLTLYIADSEGTLMTLDTLNPNALPTDGRAGITAQAPEGTEWSYDEETNTFTGVNGDTTYTLTIELTGAGTIQGSIIGGMPLYAFLYDGPVSASISITTST